jgi:CubicO group peptidase (beta-lactamase class C family)
MSYDERLAGRIRKMFQQREDGTERKRFDGLYCIVQGANCCGITEKGFSWRGFSCRGVTLILLAGLSSFGLSACSDGAAHGSGPPLDVNPGLPPLVTLAPESTDDGWATSTPEAEDMDGAVVLDALEAIRDGFYPGVDGLVVARNDRLVAEGYFNGFGRESRRDLRSASKSITSVLTGIAVDQGRLAVNDPIAQYIPEFESYAQMDDRKRAITVLHLLNMQSGIACNDSDPSSPGNEEFMYETADWTKFLLDLPMEQSPGMSARYCTAGVVLLGNIVANATGVPLDDFAATYLFNPLGIQDIAWRRSPDGRAAGGGGLRLRPRDSAKVGNLFLDGGVWNGMSIVSDAWVQDSRQHITSIGSDAYGYLWWKRSFLVRDAMQDCFFAFGNGGNFIFVLPLERLVVMFSASNYNQPASNQPFTILADRILPALL